MSQIPPESGPAAVPAGGCCAWPLPLDPGCGSAGRRVFRQVASELSLPDELTYDGVTMVSELAANTLHAKAGPGSGSDGGWPLSGTPELWLYLRRAASGWELVAKVFDAMRGWKGNRVPEPGGAGPDAVSGRGLQVVAGLSGGRWGHHLTRSRLGDRKAPGKAVWFALPVPATSVPAGLARARISPRQAAGRLETMLASRDLGDRILRMDEPGAGMSVLSVRRGLTVWCRGGAIRWQTRMTSYQHRLLTDLEDAAEQIVRACEEMESW